MTQEHDAGWSEESSVMQSDDLVTYLRLARLQGMLWYFMRSEELDPLRMCDDLLALVENIRHNVPLPGTPIVLPIKKKER